MKLEKHIILTKSPHRGKMIVVLWAPQPALAVVERHGKQHP